MRSNERRNPILILDSRIRAGGGKGGRGWTRHGARHSRTDLPPKLKESQETPQSYGQRMQACSLQVLRSCINKPEEIARAEGSPPQSPTAELPIQKLTSVASARPPRDRRQSLHSIHVLIKRQEQTPGSLQTSYTSWWLRNPSLAPEKIQKTMKRTPTKPKAANHGLRAVTSEQMLVEKPLDVCWANLSWRDVPLREPSPEVRHASDVPANGVRRVATPAKIAGESLGNYVNLRDVRSFTSLITPAWLLVHSKSCETRRLSRLRHASSYQIGLKEKVKKRRRPTALVHITAKST